MAWHNGKIIGRFTPSGAVLIELPDGTQIMYIEIPHKDCCVDLEEIYRTEKLVKSVKDKMPRAP